MHSLLLPCPHSGLSILSTAGVPHALRIAISTHVVKGRVVSMYVQYLLTYVLTWQGGLARAHVSPQGSCSRRRWNQRAPNAVLNRRPEREDDRLAPKLDMAVKRTHEKKKTTKAYPAEKRLEKNVKDNYEKRQEYGSMVYN